jgi:sugar/nucleoside kinase (ribokinase family)
MSKKIISVLGDSNVDMSLLLSDVNKLNPPSLSSGGTCANVAAGLSKLGLKVKFFGTVGNDIYGKYVLEEMKNDNVNTQNLILLEEHSTAMVIGIVQPNSERSLFVWPPEGGAHEYLEFSLIDREHLLESDWLHVSGISLRNDPIKTTMIEVMKLFKDNNIPISFDLNIRAELWGLDSEFKETVYKAISYCDYIFGNSDEEIIPLTEKKTINEAAKTIIKGDQTLICRNGSKNVLVFNKNNLIRREVFKISPKDSIGAGDAFNTGFISGILKGKAIDEAIDYGNAVAAYKLLGYGARHLPNVKELEEFILKHKKQIPIK